MKELILQHLPPAVENDPAQIRILYREDRDDEGQEALVAFPFALTPQERQEIRWYLEEYLLAPYSVFTERAQRIAKRLPEIGTELFRAVFATDEARDLYGSVKNDLPNTRLVVNAATPEGIALPWELLRDPARKEHGELALHAFAFVRGDSERKLPLASKPTGTHLNLLYVICRSDSDDDIPFQSMARPLIALFRDREDVHLEVLRPPTYAQFAKTLQERPGFFHIVHFDGHGTFPDLPPDASGRYFETAEGSIYFEDGPKTGTQVAQALTAGQVPVVLLNACRSGMAVPGATFPSVGNQLLQAGTRAVVAMAYSVFVETAKRYMTELYERLLNGDEVALAHKGAVSLLRYDPERSTSRGKVAIQDWMVPVLFEASPVTLTTKRDVTLTLSTEAEVSAGTEIAFPEPPTFGFVGRDTALLRLERAFQRENVVLLWGMAGIGKTETAAGFGRWLADTGALEGPAFYFSFERKTTLETVVDAIGKAFQPVLKAQGIEWEQLAPPHLPVEQAPDVRRGLALRLLQQVACFLIFDNFEPVVGFPAGATSEWSAEEREALRGFLRELQQSSKSKVLVTSRRPEPWLDLASAPVELGGLPLYEAEELAYAVLRRAGLSEAQVRALPQFGDLLRYLGGNPLAMQVILPELACVSPDALLSALRSGEAYLPSDDATLGRSRSLSASLTYRLDGLEAGLRERLSVLGLFSGFINADVLRLMGQPDLAPALLRGRAKGAWAADLDRASEIGLLRRVGEDYYTQHPALPWFFHDAFEARFGAERGGFEHAFVAVYADYGEYLSQELFRSNPSLALGLLRYEEGNLRAALDRALSRYLWDACSDILYGLRRLLVHARRLSEWERLFSGVEAAATDADGQPVAGSEHLQGTLLGFHAELAYHWRDFERQETYDRRLLDIYRAMGDERNEASILHQLGMIAQARRQYEEAERWYRQALEIKQRLGDEHGAASTLHQLGRIAEERRQYEEAERWYRQALEIKQRLGDEHGMTSTLHQLGTVALERRQYEEAERWYRQALEIEQRLGDEHNAAGTLHQLGTVALERRQYEEAERWYRQSLEIKQRLGDEYLTASTLHQLGTVAEERRAFEEAERWYRQALQIKQRLGDEYGAISTLHQLGTVALERCAFEEAEGWYRQALGIEQRIGSERRAAMTLHQLGTVALERCAFEEAEGWYRQALEIEQRIGSERHASLTLRQLGTVAQERRAFEEAEQWYRQALEIEQQLGDEYSAARTYLALATLAELREEDKKTVLGWLRQAEDSFRLDNAVDAVQAMQEAQARVRRGGRRPVLLAKKKR